MPARTCLPPRDPPDEDIPAPKLVSTYPADRQRVKPGRLVLRLTFDLPMACRGSLPQNLLAACFSDDTEIWRESFDRKNLLILCDLKPGSHYELGINRRIPEHFQGLSGREPEAGGFSFDTTDEAPVTTAEEMVGRDAQVAAILAAAAPRESLRTAGSEAEAAARPSASNVSLVRVQETNKCLQPRNPPDPDVPAPKLVSTFPAQGQTVRPGILEVRFTFDLPMACTAGVEIKDGKRNPCSDPDLTEHWSQPWNRRSMRVRCRVEPGKRYILTINKTRIDAGHDPLPKLQGLGGKAAEPYELTFWTSNDPPVQTQDEADVEDPLVAAELGYSGDREQ